MNENERERESLVYIFYIFQFDVHCKGKFIVINKKCVLGKLLQGPICHCGFLNC